jgi:hypothetical protein
MDPKARQRLLAMTAEQRDAAIKAGETVEQLALKPTSAT